MKQNSNNLEKGIRVGLSFNSHQIELIDGLIGILGDDRAGVVKTIFLNYLSEKNITPEIIKKKLNILSKTEKD